MTTQARKLNYPIVLLIALSLLAIVIFKFPFHAFFPASFIQERKHEDFLVSFYAGLYSGAIYSVFTGLVVGSMIFWLQKWSEKRDLREQALLEIAAVQEMLKFELEQVLEPDLSDLVYFCAGSKGVCELLKNQPISVWKKHVEGHNALDVMVQYKSLFYGFRSDARKLEAYLKREIRIHLASIQEPPESELIVFKACHGFILGLDSPETQLAMGLEPPAPVWLEEAREIITHKEAFTDLADHYKQSKSNMCQALTALKNEAQRA